ncbi:MAG: FecR domain-containing protein [Pseudomonadota bacterium]|nr:FecR domain-containing protein [Pseudomonadota bacterium]
MIARIILAALIISFFAAAAQAADAVVGYVKTAKGEAFIERGETVIPARINEKISKNDILKTGANSSLGVTLKDDTLIALGSNSAVTVSEFNFSPGEGNLSLVARMLKGCVEFASGIIGKLSPESVKFSTPVGDIAIRGTRFAVRIAE